MSSGTTPRIVTGVILIPLVVAAVWWAPLFLVTALAAFIAVLAVREFFAMAVARGTHPQSSWATAATIAIFAQQWAATRVVNVPILAGFELPGRTQIVLAAVLFFFVLGVAAIALAGRRPVSELFTSVSVSAAGLLFVALPLSAVVRLAGTDVIGRRLLLFTLVVVWAGDTAAYFVGRSFGKRKLAPQWSPNKTWEGGIANLIGALLVAAVFTQWIRIPPAHLAAMAALGSIAGQVGDIFESALKRSAGIKDSGSILPGHGGMYDRIDALIFAAPVVWYYFEWVVRTVR